MRQVDMINFFRDFVEKLGGDGVGWNIKCAGIMIWYQRECEADRVAKFGVNAGFTKGDRAELALGAGLAHQQLMEVLRETGEEKTA